MNADNRLYVVYGCEMFCLYLDNSRPSEDIPGEIRRV